MGETQSSQNGTIEDILKMFDEELRIWDRNVKNLKESWNKQHIFVPACLRQQIEETETRWIQIKSMIPPLAENGNPKQCIGTTTQNVSHCLRTNADSNFVKTNDETLPGSTQKTKLERLRENTTKLHAASRYQEASSNSSSEEIANSNESGNPRLKHRAEDAHLAFVKKMMDFEEEFENEKAQMKEEKRKLIAQKNKLEERVKQLERASSDALARHKEGLETHKLDFSNKQIKETLQKHPTGETEIENQTEEETWGLKNGQREDEMMKKHQELLDEKNKLQEQIKILEICVKKLQAEKDELLNRSKEESKRFVTTKRTECAEQQYKGTLQQKPSSEFNKQKQTNLEIKEEQYEQMVDEFKKKQTELLDKMKMQQEQKINLEIYAKKLQAEKDELLNRLSKMAGERLVDNNPAITDLSDQNRPVKLGELYSEIYDNEWTDAFEALKAAGYEEKTAVETLRLTIKHVMKFCESKADLLLKKSSDAVKVLFEEYQKPTFDMKTHFHLSMPQNQAKLVGKISRETSLMEDIKLQQRWKSNVLHKGETRIRKQSPRKKTQTAVSATVDVESILKKFRKEIATYLSPAVQKGYLDANNWANDCVEDLKPYILKCLYLGWMMVVQSPPMVLHNYPDEMEIKFDKNFYKEYTASGPIVSYIVWPALLLNENGPLVCKGVAEGKKRKPGNTEV